MRPLLAVLLVAVGGCAGAPTGGQPRAPGVVTGDLLVFAAASLTEVFEQAAEEFERAHPGLAVDVNLAGSQRLAGQIQAGAPADVFASASNEQMDLLAEQGLLRGSPATMATNELAIAVEPGNPLRIDGVADLEDPDVVVVAAEDDVPAGDYARRALDAAGVDVTAASLEIDVRAVLAKVALGEADAGLVYASDIIAAGDRVDGVAIPDESNVAVTYPTAVLAGAPNPGAAQAFVDFMLSERGEAILTAHGFAAP